MRQLALALLALAAAPAFAQVAAVLTPAEAEAGFRRAGDACLKEQYPDCVAAYQQLADSGYGSSDLEYNLGTALLRQGKLGLAVLHLERALRLDPSDADARANLDRARQLRVDKLVGAPEERPGEEPLAQRIAAHTDGQLWTALFLGLWCLGGLLLAALWIARPPALRAACKVAGSSLLLLALPCAAVTACHAYLRERAHEAVVVVEALPVREGPQPDAKPAFEVHEGLKVRVLDQEGGFRRIRLSNGLQGWVPAPGVTEITPG